MEGENKERWKRLCEQASSEKDPVKLLQLVQEINRLLRDKENRLRATRRTEPSESES
jgi:hypothetical protein